MWGSTLGGRSWYIIRLDTRNLGIHRRVVLGGRLGFYHTHSTDLDQFSSYFVLYPLGLDCMGRTNQFYFLKQLAEADRIDAYETHSTPPPIGRVNSILVDGKATLCCSNSTLTCFRISCTSSTFGIAFFTIKLISAKEICSIDVPPEIDPKLMVSGLELYLPLPRLSPSRKSPRIPNKKGIGGTLHI